jgi:hypothetical protein
VQVSRDLRIAVIAAGFITAAGCGRATDPAGAPGAVPATAPAPAPAPASNAKQGERYEWKSLDGQVVAVPLDCGDAGYTATYVASALRHPEYVVVTFTGAAPRVAVAERAIRTCMDRILSTKRITSEILGTAWHTPGGRQGDAQTIVMPDGSSVLVYVPSLQKVITWKERWPPPVHDRQAGPAWDAAAVRATVAQVASVVQQEYLEPAAADRAAADLRARVAAGEYVEAPTPEALAKALTRDLYASTKDKHISVSVVAPRRSTVSKPSAPAVSRRDGARRDNGGVQRVEILAGNVGYLNVTSFWRIEEAREALAAAMGVLRNADAVIVDMRRNFGGAPDTVALLLSYFIERPGVPLFEIVPRRGSTTRYATQEVSPADRNARRPVYVLTSGRTFSAGEGVGYLLQDQTRAEVIGERTAGAANPGRPYPVNDRFEVTVPNGRVQAAKGGGNWQASGVTPDVEVPESDALRTAHLRALRRLAAEATGEWQAKLQEILTTLERR